ncbi:dCTP deaminase [Maridesulfovibrio ferrireducens]|uniref:dCTP deaminase n=1 Tax=Maridesulfovibrio ferrireducens TaxID=246191 RepID=UPI001A301788|nr:dCTP deaminase [Maridesulfovibrio ferrireducens]MBI9109892.1 dCTP deaminase [Maridesulfovibrio ferrireducens]
MLADKDLEKLISSGEVKIEPKGEYSISPASIDLRLGCCAYRYTKDRYTLGEEFPSDLLDEFEFIEHEIGPNDSAHIALAQSITIPESHCGILKPRSSITRLGLSISEIFIQPGYSGVLPVHITNNSSMTITIVPGVRAVQLVLFSLSCSPRNKYEEGSDAKYFKEQASHSLIHTDQELSAMAQSLRDGSGVSLYRKMMGK